MKAISAVSAKASGVEMLFVHLKRILKLEPLRLRGPYGANDEFHLVAAAAAQNLRKLAKLFPVPLAQSCANNVAAAKTGFFN